MSKLTSFVPDLLVEKGWDTKTFAAYCMLKGMSPDTAYRLARGETNFTAETLVLAAEVLGLKSIAEVMDVSTDGQ